MADKIPNPLPVPEKRPHEEMDYDFPVREDPEKEDDFDIEIDENDDFDL